MNVSEYLLSGDFDDAPALLTLTGEYRRRELRERMTRVASALVSMGGQRQDRILLIAENSFFWTIAYLAILWGGRICVPLPPTISAADLDSIIQSTQPALAFVQGRYVNLIHREHSTLILITEQDIDRLHSGSPVLASREGDELAALMFTSGSTGTPRGVMVTHRNIIANTESIIEYLHLTNADRILTVLPFHYCFGTSILHTHLRVAATVVLSPNFIYADKVLQRMKETRCTGFAGVPSHFQILLRHTGLKRMSFPHLRYVQQAGGNLAPVFVRELQHALPGVMIFIMYGQTEATARLTYLPPELLSTKPDSIGKAIPGVHIDIIDEQGKRCPPGQVGEIVASGDNITVGYWNEPEETASTFRDGRLHTGDLAVADNDGFIRIVDRKKDFLKCGGNRVSSREIEQRMLEYEGICEAAAVGMPDEVLGEAVKVFVVPTSPNHADLDQELRGFCRRRLPPHLVPKEIVFLDRLPKNSAGKVLKAELRRINLRSDTSIGSP